MSLLAKRRVSVLGTEDCCDPLDFFENLPKGSVLMESAAQGSPSGSKSVVVPEAVVRLETRQNECIYTSLSPAGERLLTALPRVRLPDAPPDPSLSDEERLMAPSVLDSVRSLVALVEDDEPDEAVPPPGVYGVFAYELVDRWERLPPRGFEPWNEPDINLLYALDVVVFDHLAGEVQVVTRACDRGDQAIADARHDAYLRVLRRMNPPAVRPLPTGVEEKAATPDVSDEHFLESVRKFLRHIERGDIFQGVLSRGLTMRSEAPPLSVYRALRRRNPSPYMFYVDLGNGVLLGASPETCLKVTDRRVEIRPIAGTAPRGFREDGTLDEELDSRLAVGLLLDPKEQAEHAMLVDLARNDVARVSVPGTRRVSEPFTIEKYSHVQHLVSGVTGELRPDLDALHAYKAAANMGTLTGAPKLRAMELIRETEPKARGFYGGAVGYFLRDGSFDSAIVIRSLRYGRNGIYETRAGAGIVADSVPENELEETMHKARAPRYAVACAEKMT